MRALALSGLALLAVAWLAYRVAGPLARVVVRTTGLTRRHRPRPARLRVIEGLVADALRGLVVLASVLYALAHATSLGGDDLVWIVGLMSAGFGFAARPVLSDLFHGLSFIFGDAFAVGEKIQLPGVAGEVEGTVERVGLRDLRLRAQTGELYIVPNGEVRVVRNFGRGLYSVSHVTIRVHGDDLDRTVALLHAVKDEALEHLPDVLEPWRVLSQDGAIGKDTELSVVFKAAYGQAAELRPRLLGFLQRRLSDAGIELVE